MCDEAGENESPQSPEYFRHIPTARARRLNAVFMGEAVGQHLSDDRHRNLRCLGSFCADNLASPPDVFQYVILTHPEKIIDVILKQLHIKEGEFLIRCKYGRLQSDRMCVSKSLGDLTEKMGMQPND